MADNNEVPASESQPSDEETAAQEPQVSEATSTLSSLSIANPPIVEDVADEEEIGEIEDLPDEEDIRREFMSLLPPAVLPRIEQLKTLHGKRDELLERYQVERAALELKYAELMGPLYEERRRVVNGEAVGEGDADGDADGEDVKGIPQFWACAMGNMDVIAELITEG